MKKLIATSAVVVTLLVGCGSGGGGGAEGVNSPPQVRTGVLHDSPVGGVRYSTPTRTGVTNSLGQFYYLAGEIVTFRIGDFVLGQTAGSSVVIPMALKDAGGQAVDPILSLQLLQTLDADNNPSNGITIPPNSYPAGHLANLTSEEAVQAFLTSANISSNLVTATAAVEHFMATIETVADNGDAPASAVAPRSYTKLRAVVVDRDPANPIVPDPACSLDNVGEVTVNRSTAVWSPETVTVRINQKDYLLPGPGNRFVFEDDTAKVSFAQPQLASVSHFAWKPKASFLDDYHTTAWMATGFQKFDDGMGVVSYSDKVSGCSYGILMKDSLWYAQRSNLLPRSQLSASLARLDGCQSGTVVPLDGSATYCAGDTGDKWFTYFSGVFDPDGYVGKVDWQVDLNGADWINGSCTSGEPREGKILRNEGKVIWSCDDHNQVSLKVHLNWLNPLLAQGYPGHSVTITPYDNNLMKGDPSTISMPGKEVPQSSIQCVLDTSENGDFRSFCVNSENFLHGFEIMKAGDYVMVDTYNGGCLVKTETYPTSGSIITISNSTCTPNVNSQYTYTETYDFGNGNVLNSETTTENRFIEAGIVEWCSAVNLFVPGQTCQLVPSVTIPADIASLLDQTITPSCMGGQVAVGSACQCPAGETLVSGVCVAAPLTGTPDAQGCFLVDPNKLAIDAVRGNFFLGDARVTLNNSSSLRVVAEVQFTGGGAADKGQVSIVSNGTNRWTGGESSLTGYKVEFWGSTTPANDWVCHKPEFTQIKSGSL